MTPCLARLLQHYGVCEGIPEAEWFEMMQKSGKDVYHYTPEGGEPSESVHQRLTDFFWVRIPPAAERANCDGLGRYFRLCC